MKPAFRAAALLGVLLLPVSAQDDPALPGGPGGPDGLPPAIEGEGPVPPAGSEPPANAEEPVLPTAFPLSRYLAIWENSPFNREVVKPAGATIQSAFAQSLVLEGLVNDDRRGPMAFVRDTREDLSLIVTREKSSSPTNPYTLVSASLARRPEETKITITDGKETAEIGYVAASLTQAISAPAASAPPAARPQGRDPRVGSPAAPAGIPQQGGGGALPGAAAAGVNAVDPVPPSLTPALDKIDSEPRRRRVPLPGN